MTSKKLFTVILDYRGGTYIDQTSADSPAAALTKWVSKIKEEDLAEWKISRSELVEITKSNDLVPLNGCLGVWCARDSTKHGLALINSGSDGQIGGDLTILGRDRSCCQAMFFLVREHRVLPKGYYARFSS